MEQIKKSIEKALVFLSAFKEGKEYKASVVRKEVKISATAVTLATKLGFLKKDGKYYATTIPTPTIKHAQELVEAMREYSLASKKNVVKRAHKGNKPRSSAATITGTDKEKNAVKYLKGLGYKILMPVSEYMEL